MAETVVQLDPSVVAGLGNEMLSISTRLRAKPAAVGTSTIASLLGHAGEGSGIGQGYALVAQSAMDAVDALCGSLETNAEYVLLAAQHADKAFG